MIIDSNLTILGISPRNSYFTKANIAFALRALLQEKTSVLVFVPDIPDIHNYLAYGYEEERARKKAASLGRSFRNAVHEICSDGNYSCADNGHTLAQVRINDWQNEVENNFLYKENLSKIEALYQSNAAFRHDVREAALHSIQSRVTYDPSLQSYFDKTGIEKGVDQAVHYVLSELAFLDVAPALFSSEHTDYIYHHEWPIYENFISGKYDAPRPRLGFRVISNEQAPR